MFSTRQSSFEPPQYMNNNHLEVDVAIHPKQFSEQEIILPCLDAAFFYLVVDATGASFVCR